jgi:hypothetical protein
MEEREVSVLQAAAKLDMAAAVAAVTRVVLVVNIATAIFALAVAVADHT